MAASSSSSSSLAQYNEIPKYEVFISFRGSDVRRGFLSHLVKALKAKHIYAFIDSELERGKDITENLYQIIEQSTLFIVIFSQNYPNSEWCLDELEKIHESMNQRNQTVFPVFYEVDPSDVQELKGSYAVQIQKRRDALVVVSNLSGFDSLKSLDDATLVDDIVASVDMKLSSDCPTISHAEGLFGIDSSIEDVLKLLRLDLTSDVRMVGIWGMGGIGKTTLATKVFDEIQKSFGGGYLVKNVRERLSKDGPIQLRDKIIQELLEDKNIKIGSAYWIDESIRRRLKRVRVLLVLDDVDTCMQLNSLLESSGLYSSDSFCPGSRVIVTSRDSQVLRSVKLESDVYEAKQLKVDKALELLSWHAFGQNEPQQGYETISKEVVRCSHGIPLALVVLGCELKKKEIRFWEETLEKVCSISPSEVHKILRISFDELDRGEKNIFLDIACCSKGLLRSDLLYILEGFSHVNNRIQRLIDKSLLEVEGEGKDETITMHDLLEQMGREIAAEEKESKGKQSELWKYDDIKEALTNKTGTKNVEAIKLDDYCEGEIDISSEAFIRMHKLRFLDFDGNIKCPKGLEFLPNSIKYLKWQHYPLKYLPSNYTADKLLVLVMYKSQLEEINWSKPLLNLKRISLHASLRLIRISDLALAPNLEEIYLMGCENLVEIGSSLKNLNKLILLDVGYCKSLSHLPGLPCSIKELKLEGSGLRKLPSMIGTLTHLKELSLSFCEKLESLPSSISRLSSLETISWLHCLNIRELPDDFGNLKSLKELDASYSSLKELPQSIQNLQNLRKLELRSCGDLIKLPEELGKLKSLKDLDVSYTDLREFPRSTQNLQNLTKLNLLGCMKLQHLPTLPPNLEMLYASCIWNEESSSIIDQYIWKVHSQPTKVHQLCVNGNRVPEWMTHRNECGSFVSLDLETLGNSINFIFCVVFSSSCDLGPPDCSQIKAVLRISESDYYDDISCLTEQYCDDIFCHTEQFEADADHIETEGEVSYVVLWHSNRDFKFVREVSFEPTFTRCGYGKIIKCGVLPIVNKQSWLWNNDLVEEALTNNTGAENVEAIKIDDYYEGEIDIISEAFINMHKLRFLDFDNSKIKCPMGLEFLPNNIKYLKWKYSPQKNFRSNYNADKLVVLEMDESQLEEITWSEPLVNLKRIFLRNSHSLIRISDLALAPNLEELVLRGCENLVEIGSSLVNLNKLSQLDVKDCISLPNLPELPCSIEELRLEGSGLRHLPSMIGNLTDLKELSMSYCDKLESLPSSISTLSSLETISLQCCSNLREFPEDFGNLESLEELNASYSGLIEFPQSTRNLQNLIKLNLFRCNKLHFLPPLPPNLEMLYATHLLDKMPLAIIDQYTWKEHSQPTKIRRLCINGSQVPEWMMFRNECGSSVSLDLEILGHSSDFIFCAVFTSNCYFSPPACSELVAVLQISETEYCNISFPDNDSSEYGPDHDSEEEESYIVLWNANLDCKFVKRVSFQPTLSECGHQKIIKCGVHPIIDNRNHRK